MSECGTVNGHAIWRGNETVSTRCQDIIERGMARLGIRPAPRALQALHEANKADAARTAAEMHTRAELVRIWCSLPDAERTVRRFCERYSISACRWREFIRNNSTLPRPVEVTLTPSICARVIAAWQARAPHENKTRLAERLGLSPYQVFHALQRAGLTRPRPRRKGVVRA